MRPETIFFPVVVLVLWTFVVLTLTAVRRIGAVMKGRIPAKAFRLGESPDVPEDVSIFNRHFMNLLEMPVLFYAGALMFYVTHQVTAVAVVLAWGYVALRFAHSAVHLGKNRIVKRLYTFAAGNFVLLAFWLYFLWRLL